MSATPPNPAKLPPPTESQEQSWLFEWTDLKTREYPELALLHHVPNGGYRNPKTAARLKREGVKPGVPDLCLPVAKGGFHGLYIELKTKRGRLSKCQRKWLFDLRDNGFKALMCREWSEAAEAIEEYLSLE